MGYYIDFIFDEEKVSCYQDAVDLFCDAGGTVHDYSDEDLPDNVRKKYDRFVDIEHPLFPYFITVYKEESKSHKGTWAGMRFSWGEEPEGFFRIMNKKSVFLSSCRLINLKINFLKKNMILICLSTPQ